jgi:menaquinone-dependent protoporphyrinogen oxidase
VRILVAYSSRHGDTRGLAAHIAATLQRRGLDVTVTHADAADRVGAYDAFVIGGAAFGAHWLNEAARFVRLHWMLLAQRPVWLFSTGGGAADALGPREFTEFAGTIEPQDSRVFAGAPDTGGATVGPIGRLPDRFRRVIPFVRPAKRAELMDRPAIEAWAERIARELALIGA